MIFHIFLGPKQTISHYHETLGEALQGTELEFSGLEIEFKGKQRIFRSSCKVSVLTFHYYEYIDTKYNIQ